MNSAEPVIIIEDVSKTFHVPNAEPVRALILEEGPGARAPKRVRLP